MNKSFLLSGVSGFVLFAMTAPVLAQQPVAAAKATDQQVAQATEQVAQAQTASSAIAEEIIVYGQGLSRQAQTITASQIALQTPGTSAIKLLDQLPSVNFQSADPFGAYEWAVRISVRGFNQNQMGFTL